MWAVELVQFWRASLRRIQNDRYKIRQKMSIKSKESAVGFLIHAVW